MNNINNEKTKLKLYKKITELQKEIEALEAQIKGMDTSVEKWVYVKLDFFDDAGDWIFESEEDKYRFNTRIFNKISAEIEELKSDINTINTYMDELPKQENMNEEQMLEYEIFCKNIFELIQYSNNTPALICKYINEYRKLQSSKHWYKTECPKADKTVNIFGEIYEYNPKKFSLRSMLQSFRKKQEINDYDCPSETIMENFHNLQNFFKYSIFDQEIIIPAFEMVKRKHEKELKSCKVTQQNVQNEAQKAKQVLDNAKLAKEIREQIKILNEQKEEALRQFSLIEDDSELSNSNTTGKTYKKTL